MLLPVEVLGPDRTTESRTLTLTRSQSESVRALRLQLHGLRYSAQASVQVNTGPWIPLRNDTVAVAAAGSTFGGIGGGFATLVLTVTLPNDTVVAGPNVVRFRFNQSDGLSSGYRVLALNFLSVDGKKVKPAENFVEDVPENWVPPLSDAASIEAGKELWHNAPLVASSLPNSPRIQARCADCHAVDGRDLKYFNFSNRSIVARSVFHGLTPQEGEQIASYIRSLSLPHPGRPWNPPYQPGPGQDEQAVSDWAAGAGLESVVDHDVDALPYLLAQQRGPRLVDVAWHPGDGLQITPDLFRPDGNISPHEIPIAMQLPDWDQWLPRIHPKDAWGPTFETSKFASMYDGGSAIGRSHAVSPPSLRALLVASESADADLRAVLPAFTHWSQFRRAFLARFVNGKTIWSPELAEKVYSTQLWQLVKTWEMTQEFGLEGRGHELYGSMAESRTWCNSVPADTAPSSAHIPNGHAGVGGSALTNQYLSASWYELQIILNSGNHRHQDRRPVDWVYVIHEFRDLYDQTHEAEPVRLLVAVTKALQSTDPRLGPEDYSKGWRPEQNVDPRIMVSPAWKPMFKPLPEETQRALLQALLAAWMEKNLEYLITTYLPLPVPPHDDKLHYGIRDISGGRVWEAAAEFRAAGVSDDLVERLKKWGLAYTDRAARLQYH